ncbi:MAG: hypothetical protein FJ271_17915 [Planctomycetes bacterium]|nr:hypothetical protein [Planctomycetota bacterium]
MCGRSMAFLLLASFIGSALGDPPDPARVRATSGDPVEPKWDERLTVTVGPGKADIVGANHKALQAAVDYVARLGGGTVQVLPGTYRLRNAVHLASGVRIRGSGKDTVLIKEPSISTKLAADSDWYDQEITLVDAKGFQIGDGVCIRAQNPHNGGQSVLKRTLVARTGKRFKLDRALRENFWLMGQATVSTLAPILTAENAHDMVVENLVLDGNKSKNDNLDGNYAGCIFMQDCRAVAIRGVTARNYNGDGISWQICHDVLVEHCHVHGNVSLGLHPGSGSQRPIMRGNRIHDNDIGIFFCWGVKFGLAEKNMIENNRSYGVSIGHRDTDNLVRDNDIKTSGKVGVLFRPERGKAFAPHRNRLIGNRLTDNAPADGYAIDVQGETEDILIEKNVLHETRPNGRRTAIRIGPKTRNVQVRDNHVEGFARETARQ